MLERKGQAVLGILNYSKIPDIHFLYVFTVVHRERTKIIEPPLPLHRSVLGCKTGIYALGL